MEGRASGPEPPVALPGQVQRDQVVDEVVPFTVAEVGDACRVPEAGHDTVPVGRSLRPELRHDLLGGRQPIARAPGDRLHETPGGAPSEHGSLFEVVIVQREDHAVDRSVEPMPGPADALHEPDDLVRGTELNHVIDGADIDPELERGCGH